MDVIAALIQREPPVIIDDQLRAKLLAELFRLMNLGGNHGLRRVFDAQLHEFDAAGQQATQPFDVIDDEVKRVEFHVI